MGKIDSRAKCEILKENHNHMRKKGVFHGT